MHTRGIPQRKSNFLFKKKLSFRKVLVSTSFLLNWVHQPIILIPVSYVLHIVLNYSDLFHEKEKQSISTPHRPLYLLRLISSRALLYPYTMIAFIDLYSFVTTYPIFIDFLFLCMYSRFLYFEILFCFDSFFPLPCRPIYMYSFQNFFPSRDSSIASSFIPCFLPNLQKK